MDGPKSSAVDLLHPARQTWPMGGVRFGDEIGLRIRRELWGQASGLAVDRRENGG